MNRKIWQCCYTNAENREEGVLRTGWGPVAYSNDIPEDVLKRCEAFQSANSHIHSSDVYSGEGDRSVMEYFGDGNYLYIMKSNYGLMDRAGRPNMFSHGYIIPWDEENVMNPGLFLSIDDNNFKTTVEEADNKKNEIDSLERKDDFQLENFLREIGIERNSYATLIRCIFIQFGNKRLSRPLYIQYDGGMETIRKLLYCIYTGIPLGMRRNLKAASCEGNNADKTNIIFSHEAYKKNCYVDPKTGENNVLTDKEIEIIRRLRFIDYAVIKYSDENNINRYFKNIDETAHSYGDDTGLNEKICRLSHYMNNENEDELHSLSTDELQELVDIIFDPANTKEEKVQSALAEILNIFKEKGKGIYSDNEQRLINLLEDGSTDVLSKTAHEYFICRLETLPGESAEKLLGMFSDDNAKVYREYITNDGSLSEEDSKKEPGEMPEHMKNAISEGNKSDEVSVDEKLYVGLKKHITELRNEFSYFTDDEIFECIKKIFGEISGYDITDEDSLYVEDIENVSSLNADQESVEKKEDITADEGLKTEEDSKEETSVDGISDVELQKIVADGMKETGDITEREQRIEEKGYNTKTDKKSEKARITQEKKEEKDRRKQEKRNKNKK